MTQQMMFTQKLCRIFVTVFFLLSLAATANSQPALTVGAVSATPGQKASGFLDVPAGLDPGTKIPVVVVQGTKPGPVLALVSGSHGTEYSSIIALEKMIARLDPQEISGTVIILPLVNLASFEQKVPHINPVDRKSMNRLYPGKADGSQTERVAWAITHEVVDKCDYLIDYHGGDLDENLRPYGYWAPTGNAKQDAISREMALSFGLDHIVLWTDRPTDLSATRYLDNTSSLRGKPSIAVEAGYAGTTDSDDISVLVNGSLSVMRYLKMLPGASTPIEKPVWIAKIVAITSDQGGIFYPLVRRGTYAAAGMKIGYVTDYFGATISEVRAPMAGVVLYICSVPSMNKNDNVAYIGVVAANAP